MNGIRRWFFVAVASVLTAGMTVIGSPAASAYGAANWQVAFSGNFNNTTGGGGANGFWGWVRLRRKQRWAERDPSGLRLSPSTSLEVAAPARGLLRR